MSTIRKFLDLSTSHVPEGVSTNIPYYDGVVSYELDDNGWFVWVPGNVDEHMADYTDAGSDTPTPDEFIAVLRHARANGCDYVLLDRDGPLDPDLPTWEW